MKRIAVLAAALLAAPLARAETTPWNMDPSHSHASFSVRHLGISNVRGEFGKVDGALRYDPEDVTRSQVEATVDVTTIDTREAKRDAHLKSPDFFDAANHPKMTFKSTKVEKAGDKKLKVTGDLTIRGNTKPVTLDVELNGPIKDMQGAQRVAAVATGKIDRHEYGLKWNNMLEATPVVGDEVSIELAAEFVQAPAAPGAQAKAESAAAQGKQPAKAKK
jgi:polyisoprenoid-binding protein YceI